MTHLQVPVGHTVLQCIQDWCHLFTLPNSVRQAEGRDCVYGEGVYLTTLQPDEHSKEQVARNNYGGAWKSRLEGGSLDCYLELEIRAVHR